MPIAAKHWVKIKFLIVGGWNTLVGYFTFVLLDTLFSRLFTTRYIAYMTAMVAANIISIMNAYVFHKYVTFKSEARGKGLVSEFFRFCATYLAAFILNLILLPSLVELCRIPPKVAGALAIPVCTVLSYLGHSRFSFSKNRAS
jgi:putative flippase GtrA